MLKKINWIYQVKKLRCMKGNEGAYNVITQGLHDHVSCVSRNIVKNIPRSTNQGSEMLSITFNLSTTDWIDEIVLTYLNISSPSFIGEGTNSFTFSLGWNWKFCLDLYQTQLKFM